MPPSLHPVLLFVLLLAAGLFCILSALLGWKRFSQGGKALTRYGSLLRRVFLLLGGAVLLLFALLTLLSH